MWNFFKKSRLKKRGYFQGYFNKMKESTICQKCKPPPPPPARTHTHPQYLYIDGIWGLRFWFIIYYTNDKYLCFNIVNVLAVFFHLENSSFVYSSVVHILLCQEYLNNNFYITIHPSNFWSTILFHQVEQILPSSHF